MQKSEITEIKKRFKKEKNSFGKVMGCYVNGQSKEIICSFNKHFQALGEDDMFKFLDIANKILSGRLGDRLMEFEFPSAAETEGGRQAFLYGLSSSCLGNEKEVEKLYADIIREYEADYNFLIVLFQDDYDVIRKSSDGASLDESEETFSYILCGICPVELSKAGLGYLSDEKDIGSIPQSWTAKAPEAGFMFPVFTDRSSDIHHVLFSTKNALAPHSEIVEKILGCQMEVTDTEKKGFFEDTIRNALTGEDEETVGNAVTDIRYNLYEYLQFNATKDGVTEEVELTPDIIDYAFDEKGYPEDALKEMKKAMKEFVKDNTVMVNSIASTASDKIGALRSEKKELVQEIAEIKGWNGNGQAVIKVADRSRMKRETIDGKECLVIPVEDIRD